jgi:6-phosphogluconate dehydrogenase
MQLGMIGAGKMGANMARRLRRSGHDVVLTDVDADVLESLAEEGFATAADLSALVSVLEPPRVLWVMIPAAFVATTVDVLVTHCGPGDVVVDGGNSWYRHAIDRAGLLGAVDAHFVDVGTSGGVHGIERGYCLMVGGDDTAVARIEPLLEALSPGVDAAPRTEDRSGDPTPAERGWLHCGPSGAGHFVKMVHNGIEYGMMAAYAEGLNLLERAGAAIPGSPYSADAGPQRDPVAYRYDFDVAEITEVWRRGSVIGSWLLDLTAHALLEDPTLAAYDGSVADSGEGRWTVQAAIDVAAPTPVLASAVFSRFESRGGGEFAGKVLSAMRNEFGGHAEGRSGTDDMPQDPS